MTTLSHSLVKIQTSEQSVPSIPIWFGEVTLLAHHLSRQELLEHINKHVRFARRRFGHYEVIDFLAVLFGYAISGERTLEAFYERTKPWAKAFMALFGRNRLPARSTLSRFLVALQADGTLRCPADQSLSAHERRREADGRLRVVYAASIRSCRPCALRDQCQWLGSATAKPRQVSVLLHPLVVGSEPLLWRDWSRRLYRRICQQLLRSQRVEVQEKEQSLSACAILTPVLLSRAQRAHYRLDFAEKLARNLRTSTASQVTIRLFGVPERFATSLGLATASWRFEGHWISSFRTSMLLRVEPCCRFA